VSLDVGCGLGELGHRFVTDLGARVCAIDISPRMVELAKSRGFDARVADGEIVFPDTESLRTFVSSTIARAHLAPSVPGISQPFRATTRHVVFVARRPR
jgi:ubiquinone/menaquinone biosynthesis C-methylase UbiE